MPYQERENLAMALYLWRQVLKARYRLCLFEATRAADRHVGVAWE